MTKAKKTAIITHSDLDGVGCAIFARMRYGTNTTVIYANYGNIDELVMKFLLEHSRGAPHGVRLLVTDICPKGKDTFEHMHVWQRRSDAELMLIDHHKDTLAAKSGHDWVRYRSGVCGTSLVFEYLCEQGFEGNEARAEFAETVNAQDIWLLDSPYRPRAVRMAKLLYFWGFDRFVDEFTKDPSWDMSNSNVGISDALIRQNESQIARTLKQQVSDDRVFTDTDGHKYVLLIATGDVSTLCHTALNDNPELDYAVNVNPLQNKVDLRSRKGGVDVSKVASRIPGGGGHAESAGAEVKFDAALLAVMRGVF